MVSAFRDPYAMSPPPRERRAALARRGLFSSTMLGSATWCALLLVSAMIVARWPNRAPDERTLPSVEVFLPPPVAVPVWKAPGAPAGGAAKTGIIKPVDLAPVLPAPEAATSLPDLGLPTTDPWATDRTPVGALPHDPVPLASDEPVAYVDVMPEATLRVEPEYPELARLAGMEGVVRMEAVVARDGTVRSTRILEPGGLFDEAATRAAMAWRFHPATVNGHAVTARVGLTFRFRLR